MTSKLHTGTWQNEAPGAQTQYGKTCKLLMSSQKQCSVKGRRVPG